MYRSGDEPAKDEDSVLFQFVNENNALKVGFCAFITNNISDEEIEFIVNDGKVIGLKWPQCQIGPANKIKFRLKPNTVWIDTAAKVIAVGGEYTFITANCKN